MSNVPKPDAFIVSPLTDWALGFRGKDYLAQQKHMADLERQQDKPSKTTQGGPVESFLTSGVPPLVHLPPPYGV